MSTIQNIEGTPFKLPMRGALRWGSGSSLSYAEHTLITVTLEGGITAYGEALSRPTIYGETPQSIQGALEHVSKSLVGLEVTDTAAIAKVLGGLANNHTTKGGLDMAFWEARAKLGGVSLFDTFAGPQKQLKVSYILGISSATEMLEEAARVHASGVRVFKVKVGRDYQKDLAVISQMASQLEGVELYADSNETLNMENAPQILEAMRGAGLLWVEEPLPVHRLRDRMALKKLGILPIIADDSCFTLAQLERELDFDTFDILNIKTPRTGFSESLTMLELARNAGKSVMIGSQAGSLISTRFAALFASRSGVDCASELSFFLKLEGDIAAPNPVLNQGFLQLEDLRNIHLINSALEGTS
jgi:L-Ala-D/L-Glu epimerase